MFDRFRENQKKNELDEDKKGVEFEKGDFLAIMIAVGSYVIPIALGIFLFIALLVKLIF